MLSAPFFSHASFPAKVKIPMALLISYGLVGLVPSSLPENIFHPVGLMIAVGIEALTGVMLGYAAQFIFWAVQYAGEVMGFQMGLALANVYNPMDGLHSNPLGRFLVMSTLLVFILLDGHHYILRAVVASFDVVPLAGARLSAGGPIMLDWTGRFFMTALRLASPFMITIFLLDVSLGVFARIAPQANLFIMGLPMKLILGLSLAVLFVQNFFPIIPQMIQQMFNDLLFLIEGLVKSL